MDHRGKTLLGIFAFAATSLSVAAFAADKPVLRAMAWLAPEGQLDALTVDVVVDPSENASADPRFAIGRALFQTPLLLGGQAAKAGISCESCHSGGTSNPHFRFPNLSGTSGTADVTHSFFSKRLGNGTFDPVPIPDLTKTGKISHKHRALEDFIRDLIVEEFDGRNPDPATLKALAYYVRSLQKPRKITQTSLSIERPLNNIDIALTQAKAAVRSGEIGIARLLIASARHQLGLVHERYADPRLEKHRNTLVKNGIALGDIQHLLDEHPERISSALLRWDKLFTTSKKILKRDENISLYRYERLKLMLNKKIQ